jgi:uncharacterized protein (TIGR00297 family)
LSATRTELIRKGVHVSMGAFALLLRWLNPVEAALCAAAALAFNLFILHRLTRRGLLRAGERDRGYSPGIALYPAAVLALILVFRDRLELAAAAWALIAFGDGMATVAGTLLRGPRLPWNPGKSWAGFVAFVLWGGASSAFLLRWVQQGALEGEGVTWIGGSFLGAGDEEVFLLAACFAAALGAAMAESLRTGIDDNILVPLVGGTLLWTATLVEPGRLIDGAPVLASNFAWGAGVNALLAIGAYAARGVGVSGAVSGFLLGTTLYGFGGPTGFSMLFLFFVVGTACTKVGYARKAALGIAQEKGGRRGAKNALANTTAGVVFAFLAAATPIPDLFAIALVAAFATAASDTTASEIGQAFGRTHVLVTNFRRVPAGTDGAVSIEGTVSGIAASAVIAGAAWASGLVDVTGFGIVVVAAFFGSTLESYLGATFERMALIDNEVVNFANTVAGGLAALGLAALVS